MPEADRRLLTPFAAPPSRRLRRDTLYGCRRRRCRRWLLMPRFISISVAFLHFLYFATLFAATEIFIIAFVTPDDAAIADARALMMMMFTLLMPDVISCCHAMMILIRCFSPYAKILPSSPILMPPFRLRCRCSPPPPMLSRRCC